MKFLTSGRTKLNVQTVASEKFEVWSSLHFMISNFHLWRHLERNVKSGRRTFIFPHDQEHWVKADSNSMPLPCRAHAVPLSCRAANGLECVFPIWFTQFGRVWFTLGMPCPCHAPTTLFFSRSQHSTAVERRTCCSVSLRRTARSEHGKTSVNQTWPHCVNQMGHIQNPYRHGMAGERLGCGMDTACYVWIGLKTIDFWPPISDSTCSREWGHTRSYLSCIKCNNTG